MALVPAYDTRTGQLVEHLVPDTWIGHPVLGPHLSTEPPAPAEEAEALESPARTKRRAPRTQKEA